MPVDSDPDPADTTDAEETTMRALREAKSALGWIAQECELHPGINMAAYARAHYHRIADALDAAEERRRKPLISSDEFYAMLDHMRSMRPA